jgi:hypothetical protein
MSTSLPSPIRPSLLRQLPGIFCYDWVKHRDSGGAAREATTGKRPTERDGLGAISTTIDPGSGRPDHLLLHVSRPQQRATRDPRKMDGLDAGLLVYIYQPRIYRSLYIDRNYMVLL